MDNKLVKDRSSRLAARLPKTQAKGKAKKRDIIVFASIAFGTLLIVLLINRLPYERYSSGMAGAAISYEVGRVEEVLSERLEDSAYQKGLMTGEQTLRVRLLTGKHKGEMVEAGNYLSAYSSVLARTGKYLVFSVDELDNGVFQVRAYNYFRAPVIFILALAFLAALVSVGGKKGLMSGFGLAYTFICVFLVFLPLVLRGCSPLLSVSVLVFMVTFATMVLLNGPGRKSLCAVLGTLSGVLVSGAILAIFSHAAHISGFNTEEAESLLLISQTTGLKVRELLYSGILIASLGAVMDTSVSMVSTMFELKSGMPEIKSPALIRAGINVGRDIIGSMSNTLILAFTGSAVNTLIILYSYSVQLNQLLSMNMLAIEIAQALSGSLGIILTVPLTAAITASVLKKSRA